MSSAPAHIFRGGSFSQQHPSKAGLCDSTSYGLYPECGPHKMMSGGTRWAELRTNRSLWLPKS